MAIEVISLPILNITCPYKRCVEGFPNGKHFGAIELPIQDDGDPDLQFYLI